MADISGKIRNENIRKFLAIMEKDKELQKKFSRIRNPGEAYALAASIQGGFTQEEFVTEMKRLYEELTLDLSEEDMAKVAGGLSEVTGLVVGTVASVGAGMSAAFLLTGSAAAL